MSKSVLIICMFLICQPSFSQDSKTDHQNAPTEDRRKEWDAYYGRIQQFKTAARSAYSDEQARQRLGDCPHAAASYDIQMCLNGEVEKTTANYRAYVEAVRSMEGLTSPGGTSVGGRGIPPLPAKELVKEFDEVEAEWQKFWKAQCSTAYDAYRDGTIAPLMQLTCELRLLRDRMTELESIYQITENR